MLTACRTDGSVIASVSGDQGSFLGIEAPDMSYALWEWDSDQSVMGFSLDNVTFSLVPEPSVLIILGVGALHVFCGTGRRRRQR